MKFHNRQRGAALIVSLLMLTVMTLLAVTSIQSSNVSLRIVSNVQSERIVTEQAQRGIEHALSDKANFYSPSDITYNPTGDGDNLETTVSAAECLGVRPMPGYSANMTNAPEETVWQVTAQASDAASGAETAINQGVKIIMTAGNC